LTDQYRQLRDLNAAETSDRAAIDKVYDEIFKTERQFVQASVDARVAAEKLLTDDQKKVYARWRRGEQCSCFRFAISPAGASAPWSRCSPVTPANRHHSTRG